MALIVARYLIGAVLGLAGLFFLAASADIHFNLSGWQDEVIARQTILKGELEKAGRYTEAFRREHGRLPDDDELRQWSARQQWPEAAALMDSNLHLAPAGEGCFLGDEEMVRGYSLCYFNGASNDWKFAPQSGDHNLKLQPSDFGFSLDYKAGSLASFLIPFMLAFWAWPKAASRRQRRAVGAVGAAA